MQPIRFILLPRNFNRTIIWAKLIPLSLLFLLLIAAGCSQFINKPMSGEYIAGQKQAQIYAKQDAIESRCINYPVSLSNNMLNNTRKHIERFKGEKSTEFINGFSQQYQNEYREYMSLYCDNGLDLESTQQEYVKP